MSGMFGADVAQLRQAAAQFDRHAQQLDADRMTVGNAIRISAWVGPFATSFRMQWDSEHSRRVHDAAMRLRDAAQKLRSNADEQERASATDGGSPGVRRTYDYSDNPYATRPQGGQIQVDPRSLVDGVGSFVESVGMLDTMSELFGPGSFAPKVLGPVGVMFDTAAFVDSINERDGVGAFLNGVSAAMGAAGSIASRFNPLALSVTVAKTFVDWTLPYNSKSADETYVKGVELMFGPHVDPDHLTADQVQKMAKRYDGVLGVANMISDRMDATADAIFPWNWGKK